MNRSPSLVEDSEKNVIFFSYPLSSKYLNIYIVNILGSLKKWRLNKYLKRK